jgi:hypothetical protein
MERTAFNPEPLGPEGPPYYGRVPQTDDPKTWLQSFHPGTTPEQRIEALEALGESGILLLTIVNGRTRAEKALAGEALDRILLTEA